MILGTDANGKVLLVVDTDDPGHMPAEFNGATVIPRALTEAQEASYRALPAQRGGATFDGTNLAIIEAPIVPTAEARRDPLKEFDAMRAVLKAKGVADITDADIEIAKAVLSTMEVVK